MGWGTGNLGGGSGGLNFKVVGYATEDELLSDTPKENTIGVITQTAITSWIFSATEPTNPTSGMVWISVDASSNTAFNALKKNGIMVYPMSAKQCISGALVDKTSKIYQDGQWSELLSGLYIFKEGTGVADGYVINAIYTNYYGFEVDNEKITWGTNTGIGNQVVIDPMVDLTSYNLLCVELTCTGRYNPSYTITIGVGSDRPTAQDVPGSFDASASSIYDTTRKIYEVPISNISGERYIKIAAYAVTGYIHNIWLR